MKKHAIALGFAASLVTGINAQALSLDWAGTYRFEYQQVDKTSLGDPGLGKNYFLNQLSLSPKIIAADGFNIVARFEVFGSDLYPDSQVGSLLGSGPTRAKGPNSSTADDSAVASDKQKQTNLKVSQLYANINQEYGSILLGRAPLQFGLGITHSAGTGPFDHWMDTRDLVAYKFIVGNLSMMPAIGKVYQDSPKNGGQASDLIFDIEYNNPETDSQLGVFHQTRSASNFVDDAPASALGGVKMANGEWKTQHVNVFLARGFEDLKIQVEGGFNSGNTGVETVAGSGDEVRLNGYGIALEVLVGKPQDKWNWNFRAGIASGNDPSTTNYEGYHFDRNYDLAMLLFNHPLGQFDVLGSGFQRSPAYATCTANPCGTYSSDVALDEESVTNAVYFSPKATYTINDRWQWQNTLTWSQLQVAQHTGASKDLGYEWDTGFIYKPHPKVMWVNELGLLFPGSAFEGAPTDNGGQGYGHDFTYGFSSKAAISF